MPHDRPRRIRLGARDQELLRLLADKVPVLSLRQIADAFFAGDKGNAVRSLSRLLSRQLISSQQVSAKTPPAFRSPVVAWTPGQNPPSATRLSYQLGRRWAQQGIRTRQCYLIGPRYAALTGISNPNHLRRPLHASHELAMADLYLHFHAERPTDARNWLAEQVYCQPHWQERLISRDGCSFGMVGQKPDALLVDENGVVIKAIELGGVYNAKRLERFHRWCQRRRLPYEIW